MDLLPAVRILWQRRVLVGLGALAAIAVVIAGLPSEGARSSVGEARVLLDAPNSLLTAQFQSPSDIVATQATVLADLAAGEGMKRRIASAAGVPPSRLAVVGPSDAAVGMQTQQTSLSEHLATAERESTERERYAVSILQSDPQVPIVEIQARAPGARLDRRLVQAAVSAFETVVAQQSRSAGGKGYVAERLGEVQVTTHKASSSKFIAPMVAIALFGGWCVAIVLATSATRLMRAPIGPATAASNGHSVASARTASEPG